MITIVTDDIGQWWHEENEPSQIYYKNLNFLIIFLKKIAKKLKNVEICDICCNRAGFCVLDIVEKRKMLTFVII